MIIGLKGRIRKKELSFCDVETAAGLIYRVFISLNCYSLIKTSEVEFLITQIIKEDGHFLYGFLEPGEKTMFEMLLKVSGIGAKSAMAVCSSFLPAEFARVLELKDLATITKVPGIGKKTASLILVELGEFDFASTALAADLSPVAAQASSALISLGFKKEAVAKVLSACKADKLEDLVKEALAKLTKVA